MAHWNGLIIGGAFIYLCAEPVLALIADKVHIWRNRRAANRELNRPD